MSAPNLDVHTSHPFLQDQTWVAKDCIFNKLLLTSFELGISENLMKAMDPFSTVFYIHKIVYMFQRAPSPADRRSHRNVHHSITNISN